MSFERQPYATTRWSLVKAAARELGSAENEIANRALGELCELYWLPLYAFARRRAVNQDDAQDLTQSFFEKLLEKNYLETATPQKGSFRAFLIGAFKNFIANEWKKAKAQKRGGDKNILSLDFQAGDSKLKLEPESSLTPDQIYQRQWTIQLLENTLSALRTEYENRGKHLEFDLLEKFIVEEGSKSKFQEIASNLNTTVAATKMMAHRLRKRYREVLRAEIAQTVSASGQIDDEIRELFDLFEK